MQLTVGGKKYRLDRKEVAFAKKIVLEQMRLIREAVDAEENPSVYITYLIMMNMMSGESLNSMDHEVISNALAIREKYLKKQRRS